MNRALLIASLVVVPSAAAQDLRTVQNLSSSLGMVESDEPFIAAAGDRFFAAWYEADDLNGRDIYFSVSLDGGQTFGAPIRLDQAIGATDATDPVVVAEGSLVGVFWLDDRADPGGDDDVVGRVSQDGGLTFGPELLVSGLLTGDVGDADNLDVAIDGDFIHVLFEDDVVARTLDPMDSTEDVYVASSQDGGLTFGEPQLVNRPPLGPGTADADDPTLTADAGTVWVAWVDRRNGLADKVFVNRSHDGGVTFGAGDMRLDEGANPATDTEDPRLDSDGSVFAAIWRDARTGTAGSYQVYANGSLDGGATLLGEIRIDSASTPGEIPNSKRGRVAIEGTTSHAVWADNRNAATAGVHDIFYSRVDLTAGGLIKQSEERINVGVPAGTADSGLPRVAARDGYVYAYWQDRRDDPAGDADSLYLRASRDGGVTFGAEHALADGLGAGGDAEENEFALGDYRDLVCIWGDNAGDLIGNSNDVKVNGFRFPTLTANQGGGLLNFTLSDLAPIDEGDLFLVAVSATGTGYGPLPTSTGGLGVGLTIDALTLSGLQLLPLLSGSAIGGIGQTPVLASVPIPFFAVGITWDPATGFDFIAASDPVLVLP